MAANRNTKQYEHTVSIRREALLKLSKNEKLNKRDYRVLILLFTQLDGFKGSGINGRDIQDPENYRKIDIKSMAKTLDMDKKDVKKSIKRLCKEIIIEDGSNDSVEQGYRFTF